VRSISPPSRTNNETVRLRQASKSSACDLIGLTFVFNWV
jgi:hypothetical protein